MFDIKIARSSILAVTVSICLPFLTMLLGLSGCAIDLNPGRNFAPPAAQEPAPELVQPGEIAKALRAGGYVIYMRHGQTRREELELEAKNREARRFLLTDCATQRNLSEEGIVEARAAGAAFRKLNLPVARYLSSRYCRVTQTARMFTDELAYSEALTSDGPITKQPERIEGVRALLSAKPPAGKNTMLFAHQGIFWEATRLTVQEGWAVVLEPGNYNRIVARIAPSDWARMAALP
jgi:phosphohistidine phosphatase SixA